MTRTGKKSRTVVVVLVALLAIGAVFGVVELSGGGSSSGAPAAESAPRPALSVQLNDLKLLNSFPTHHGWSAMWTKWNESAVKKNFAAIVALHGNAVRIIIQATTFGYPKPKPVMLARLAAAISVAQSDGLKVQLTLFDWWDAYDDVAGSTQWAKSILTPYANSSEIAFIELKNEVDPTDAAEMSWSRTMLPVVKGLAGSIPVTVSVTGKSTPTVLQELKTGLGRVQPDFYDVHIYGNPGTAYSQLAQDKEIVSPAPLFVGETGMSTAPGPNESSAQAEAAQDLFFRTVEWATQQLGLPAAAPWMLQDLSPGAIPPQSQLTGDQSNFGLLRTDGSEKPAAVSIANFFSTGTVDVGLNGNFAAQAGGQPLYWTSSDASAGTLAWDGTVSHSGTGSVSFTQTGGTSTQAPSFEIQPVVVPTTAGQTFQASAWVKGTAATGSNRISISWLNSTGTYLGNTQSSILALGTTPWTKLSVTSAAPAGAAYEEVSIKSSHNTGTVWFDDVTFAAVA